MLRSASALLICIILGGATTSSAFVPAAVAPVNTNHHQHLVEQRQQQTALLGHQKNASDGSKRLLQEFSISSGEIINPYEVLKVKRTAERSEFRRQYIEQSRRYHPDAMRKDGILPGKCNNMDEVREQWERIKLSYEILSDPKRRKKFDRHEALADPGQAVQRAAVNAAFNGVASLGKGVFNIGTFAFKSIAKQNLNATANGHQQQP